MNRILTIVGSLATVIYIGGILFILNGRLGQLNTMPLNEIGDFSAGIFGPIAFLWLILGFLQQGKELQQSTKALELQATELNNSVAQQKELVEVTRVQVEAERESLRIERERQLKAIKPNFVFNTVTATHNLGRSKFRTNIKNIGRTAILVTITSDVSLEHLSQREISTWETNADIGLEFVFDNDIPPDECVFTIGYTDLFGNIDFSKYKIIKKQDNAMYPSLNVVPIYS